ncbi:MAG: hypothetical protein ACTSUE_06275 [Promethearchaeota archaeon]
MPTHKISFLSDCPADCPNYPQSCAECFKDRITRAGVPFREFQVFQASENEITIEADRDVTYRKYLDVLNIRTILVLDKTGLCVYNYPVTGAEMDGNLVAGFIQANLAFSREGVGRSIEKPVAGGGTGQGLSFASIDHAPEDESALLFDAVRPKEDMSMKYTDIYELNYQNFVLAVHEANYVRSVLITDKPPSYSLKNSLVEFSSRFEKVYGRAMESFVGDISIFNEANIIIEHAFETDLLYPYSVKIISPNEEQGLDNLDRLVYRYGLDHSRSKGFFFISTVLDNLVNALQKHPKDIVHAVYRLLEKMYFVPQEIAMAAKYKEEQDEWKRRAGERVVAFGINYELTAQEIAETKDAVKFTSEKEAKSLIKKYLSTAQTSHEYGIFEDAMKNYKLAKIIAESFGMMKDVSRIEKKMDDLFHMIRQLEYDNAMKIAVNAEKNKDYLKAIQNYTLCKQILLKVFNYDGRDKRIQHIEKRIYNLQSKVV